MQCGTDEVVGGLVGDVAEQAVDQVLVALELVLDGLTVDFFYKKKLSNTRSRKLFYIFSKTYTG